MVRIKKRIFIITIAAVFLVGGGLTFGGLYLFNMVMLDGSRAVSADEYANYKELETNFSRINELRKYLIENFYREIDDETVTTGFLRGLFNSPDDPFTTYYTKEELNPVITRTTGEMSGLGITFTSNEENAIEITNVVRDSASEEAGVKIGDIIISVNGKTFEASDLDAVVQEAQGEPGTKVKLVINRNGTEHTFEITRSNFIVPSVTTSMLDGNIGQIIISTFNQGTADDFEIALTEMEDKKVEGLVIDVRNNNGGIVEQAIRMLDLIIDESVVAYTEDGQGNRETFNTEDGKTSLPYVVLINNQSASSAEIFALGVKNMKDGNVIGETTFGKGVIQKILRFDQGDGARITVMQYLAPDGTPVNGIGIKPDIEISQGGDQTKDPILKKGLEFLKK